MNDQSSRREFLAGVSAGAAAIGASLVPAAARADSIPPAPFGPGPRSGLPWHSGASLASVKQIASYRGRLCDTLTLWCPVETWDAIVSFKEGWTAAKNRPERLSVGLAMLPRTHSALTTPGVWARAASGEFDSWYDRWAQTLAAEMKIRATKGLNPNVIVRVGWEHTDDRAWFSAPDPVNYAVTFRKIVDMIRYYNDLNLGLTTVAIDWCNLKKGQQPGSVIDHYPGSTHVDIISADYYDCWPALNNDTIWNTQYLRTFRSGPWGIGAWLTFAKSQGKQFACPEWGISVGNSGGKSIDNPYYIQKMFEFFSLNAADIAYENYFNQKLKHQIAPPDVNPVAAAEYLKWWGVPPVVPPV